MKKYTIALLFPLILGLSACQTDKTDTSYKPKDVNFVDIYDTESEIQDVRTRFISGLKNVNKVIYEQSEVYHYYDAKGNANETETNAKGSIEAFSNGYISVGKGIRRFDKTVFEETEAEEKAFVENGFSYVASKHSSNVYGDYFIREFAGSEKEFINKKIMNSYANDIQNALSIETFNVTYPISYAVMTVGRTNKGMIASYQQYKTVTVINVNDKEYTQISESYSYLEGKEVGENIEITKRQEALRLTGNFLGSSYSSYILLDEFKTLREYGRETIFKYGSFKENSELPAVKQNLPKSYTTYMNLNVMSYEPTYDTEGHITGITSGEGKNYAPSAVDQVDRKATFYTIPLVAHRIYCFVVSYEYYLLKEDETTHELYYEMHNGQQIFADPVTSLLEQASFSGSTTNFYWYKGASDSTIKISIEFDQEYTSCFIDIVK